MPGELTFAPGILVVPLLPMGAFAIGDVTLTLPVVEGEGLVITCWCAIGRGVFILAMLLLLRGVEGL